MVFVISAFKFLVWRDCTNVKRGQEWGDVISPLTPEVIV